jgi:hypothetical protein
MKKFLLKITWFSFLLVVFVVLLAEVRLSDEYLIQKTYGTSYEKIAWNLNLIRNRPQSIKGAIVFLGPSLVQGGVSDSILANKGTGSLNMGVNHTGKEIELYFLNRILEYRPKAIYLFANKSSINLHPMTPLLYSPSQLLKSGQIVNYSFLDYLLGRVSFVFDYLGWIFKRDEKTKYNFSTYGTVFDNGYMVPAEFENEKRLGHAVPQKKSSVIRTVWRKVFGFYCNYICDGYSQLRFAELAHENAQLEGVKVYGLQVPVATDFGTETPEISFLKKDMDIKRLKSISSLDSSIYWFDAHHLNKEGAIVFTSELVNQKVIDQK